MSTINDKNEEQLEKIKCKMVNDFGSIQSIQDFYYNNNRRQCGDYVKSNYDISFYYFKKILSMLGIQDRPYDLWKEQNTQGMIKTHYERYGGIGFASEELRQRSLTTAEELYGDRFYNNRDLAKQTCLARYGVENTSQLEEIKQCIKATQVERYGGIGFASEELRKKSEDTCEQLYGYRNFIYTEQGKQASHTAEVNAKRLNSSYKTFMEKYGCWYVQTAEARQKMHSKYTYDSISFDSSWEIAVYIYFKDNGLDIWRNTDLYFEYQYEGVTHRYYPDFMTNDNFIEVKGSHITQQNVYSQQQGDLYKRKYECMINNGVQIIGEQQINKYINYIKDMYGKDYLRSFKNVNIISSEMEATQLQ